MARAKLSADAWDANESDDEYEPASGGLMAMRADMAVAATAAAAAAVAAAAEPADLAAAAPPPPKTVPIYIAAGTVRQRRVQVERGVDKNPVDPQT